MKKYFAKYLPVEGEIKEGDIFIHPDGTKERASRDLDGRGLSKVKLFLCTKNIQVGDRYKSPRYAESNEYIDIERYASEPMEGSFKIVGEISPEAIWIKDGDEFDEDQVKGYFEKLPYDENHKDMIDKAILQFKKSLVFKIKCSQCNTFH